MNWKDAEKFKEGDVIEFRSKNEDHIRKAEKNGWECFKFISIGDGGYINTKKLKNNGQPSEIVTKIYTYNFEYLYKIN